MPRIRSLKPEIFQSPQVMNLSRDARLLFVGLITQADDQGRGSADSRKIRAAIFPGDDDINVPRLADLKAEIAHERLAIFYTSEEQGDVYALVSWKRHQKVEKARDSIYPTPPKNGGERSPNGTGGIPDGSHSPNGHVIEGEEAGRSRYGSDLIRSEGSDLIRPLRARASDPKGLAALEEKTRILSASGWDRATIAKSLAVQGVTLEQIDAWLSPPAKSEAEATEATS